MRKRHASYNINSHINKYAVLNFHHYIKNISVAFFNPKAYDYTKSYRAGI